MTFDYHTKDFEFCFNPSAGVTANPDAEITEIYFNTKFYSDVKVKVTSNLAFEVKSEQKIVNVWVKNGRYDQIGCVWITK